MKFIKIILSLTIFFQTGCIYTRSQEKQDLELKQNEQQQFQEIASDDSQVTVSGLVYQPSVWPLEKFFKKLQNGDFGEALKNFSLKYDGGNLNENPVLQQTIDEGFVPVFVRVVNNSSSSMTISEKNFVLSNQDKVVAAFSNVYLPREFKKFSPQAAAANVVNLTVVVVGFSVVVGGLFMLRHNPAPPYADSGVRRDSRDIFNPTEKTVNVDYKDFLFYQTTLKPGQEAEGLLFFYLYKDIKNRDSYQLSFRKVPLSVD